MGAVTNAATERLLLKPQETVAVTRAAESAAPMYEKPNPVLRVLSMPIFLLFAILPKKLCQAIFLAFSGEDDDPRIVFKNATKFRALEVLYTFRQREAEGKTSRMSSFWWRFLNNTRSIWNRLQMVKRELIATVKIAGIHKQTIRILSVGSGSARPVLEALGELNGVPEVEIALFDRDQDALDFSEELANVYRVNHTQRFKGIFSRLNDICEKFRPDIIEMVGLLDYFSDETAVKRLTQLYRNLRPGGYLITGNITPNLEAVFVAKGINWPMVYRKPKKLAELLFKAGFSRKNIKIVREPLGIHTLAVAFKDPA